MSKAFDYHNYLKWDTAPTFLWEEPMSKMAEYYLPPDYQDQEWHEQEAEDERRVDLFNKRMSEFLDELEAGDDE